MNTVRHRTWNCRLKSQPSGLVVAVVAVVATNQDHGGVRERFSEEEIVKIVREYEIAAQAGETEVRYFLFKSQRPFANVGIE
jgi:hypothetical protein